MNTILLSIVFLIVIICLEKYIVSVWEKKINLNMNPAETPVYTVTHHPLWIYFTISVTIFILYFFSRLLLIAALFSILSEIAKTPQFNELVILPLVLNIALTLVCFIIYDGLKIYFAKRIRKSRMQAQTDLPKTV